MIGFGARHITFVVPSSRVLPMAGNIRACANCAKRFPLSHNFILQSADTTPLAIRITGRLRMAELHAMQILVSVHLPMSMPTLAERASVKSDAYDRGDRCGKRTTGRPEAHRLRARRGNDRVSGSRRVHMIKWTRSLVPDR
jgi:hypothetical protein